MTIWQSDKVTIAEEELFERIRGKIILHLCLSKMKERGLDKAWAQATPNSGAARAVYDKAGFETIGEYITFKKSDTKE